MAEEVTIPILLLGDSTVGKSKLLARISLGPNSLPGASLPSLRDSDQPFVFHINPQRHDARLLTQSSYRLEFFDTAYSQESYTLLRPSLVVLCYSVESRNSLISVKEYWRALVETLFNSTEGIPVVLLGLKRDLRTDQKKLGVALQTGAPEPSEARANGPYFVDDHGETSFFKCVMPQEGHRVAQEIRCDRYMECSAVTGELCREVFEDIVRTAVASSKGHGSGKTEGTTCSLM